MPLKKPRNSTRTETETVLVEVPRNLLRRPFPIGWGLATFLLFLGFAVVTQLQFNSIAQDEIQEARLDTYESDKRAYDAAVKALEDCKTAIERSDVVRTIFLGIEDMFERTADLPVELFPEGEAALLYQHELRDQIQASLSNPIENGLPPRTVDGCPKVPESPPERP